jgi:phosphoglycerate dehydrogenase-like enzyme
MVYQERDLKVFIGGPGFMVDEYAQIVKGKFPNLNLLTSSVLVETEMNQVQGGGVEDVDIVASFNAYPFTLPKMKKLKWFQVLMTGYEHILRTRLIGKDILLTNCSGTVSIPIAEVVMGYLLFFVKKFHKSLENQRLHKMDRMLGQMRELHQRKMGLLGLGHIGKVIARKAKLGFDMEVLGYDKYVKEFEYADRIYPENQLDEVLKVSDFVVISLPLIPETNGLIGERELRLMKPTAYLINVARGEILDKKAFTRALKEGWIAGAAIDVFWGDPTAYSLPVEDELWDLDHLLITAHNATGTDRYVMRTGQLFCENLARFMRGEPLINIIMER